MLVPAIYQHKSSIDICMSSPSWTSLSPPTPSHPLGCHRVLNLTSLDHRANFHWLSILHQFSSVQSFSRVWLCVTPWIAACQASLSITNSWNLLKHMSIESVMLSNHLILCRSHLLLLSIFPSIRVFSSESVPIRWPRYWRFSFSISTSNEYSGLICFRIDWFDLLAVQGILKSLLQHHISKASILQC